MAPTIGRMTTHTTAQKATCHTPAGHGPHHLMLGTVAVSRLLGGEDTDQQLAVLEVRGLPGSGPGPHLDPWRESFYVLEGELTFRVEQDGAVRHIVAHPGDALTIPSGVGHAFAVSSANSARYLVFSTAAGLEAFFADAGQPIERAELPDQPPPVDRDRLYAAFDKHGLSRYAFPGTEPGGGSCLPGN